jgi:hypothetical protein
MTDDSKAAKAAIAATVRAMSEEVEGGFGALVDVWGDATDDVKYFRGRALVSMIFLTVFMFGTALFTSDRNIALACALAGGVVMGSAYQILRACRRLMGIHRDALDHFVVCNTYIAEMVEGVVSGDPLKAYEVVRRLDGSPNLGALSQEFVDRVVDEVFGEDD